MKILEKVLHFSGTIFFIFFIFALIISVIQKIYYFYSKPWLLYEGSSYNFKGCWPSEMNKKYNYWLDQAVKQDNPILCDNVEGYDYGDYFESKEAAALRCRAEYYSKIAEKTNNPLICQKIPAKNIIWVKNTA